MAVSGVDHQHVDIGFYQRRNALIGIFANPNRGTDSQTALIVFTGVWVLFGLVDVGHCDQPLEVKIVVYYQHLFDAILLKQRADPIRAGAFFDRDKALFRRHHRGH